VTTKPAIIIIQTIVAAAARRRSSTRFARRTSQKRRPRRAGPDADRRESGHGQHHTGHGMAAHPGGGHGRGDAAEAQDRHPAHDPGRRPAAHVRAVAQARPQHLHGVVEGDKRTGEGRRQGQLDHHDPVQGRGRQDDDGAERGLDEAQPNDPEPAERDARHGTGKASGTAQAAVSMPRT
jgi:hypothetical protein